MFDSLFKQLLALLTGSFLVIPVNNDLGLAFVVLNGILLLFSTLLAVGTGLGLVTSGG